MIYFAGHEPPTNIQKVILLINALDNFNKPDCFVIKDGKLYRATWEVDYHNGDIDDYKEHLATEKEAAGWVVSLERKYADQEWEKLVEAKKREFVQNLYKND
jgi:hypothetical protein